MALDLTTHRDENRLVAPGADARIAIIIPCFNEEKTIASVIDDFRRAVPAAEIYVFDNNSTDRTAEIARNAGARVAFERRQGKGYVVQSMFARVEADIYVMVDGDGTYPAELAADLIAPVLSGQADMVIGSRLHGQSAASSEFKALNRLGNRFYLTLLNRIFGVRITDLLSGYRAFSRRLVKTVPLFSGGFDTETEMTIKALERRFTVVEIPVTLTSRPEGSHSKIKIVRDGILILKAMLALYRDYRPLPFFGWIAIAFFALSLLPGGWVISDYVQTRSIERIPSAILAVGLVLCGMLSFVVGLILHTISQRFHELDEQLRRVVHDFRNE